MDRRREKRVARAQRGAPVMAEGETSLHSHSALTETSFVCSLVRSFVRLCSVVSLLLSSPFSSSLLLSPLLLPSLLLSSLLLSSLLLSSLLLSPLLFSFLLFSFLLFFFIFAAALLNARVGQVKPVLPPTSPPRGRRNSCLGGLFFLISSLD